MRIVVNGEPVDVADGTTVADLLADRGTDGRGVAVAVDASVVPRSEWTATVLRGGEQVEILAAAQGG